MTNEQKAPASETMGRGERVNNRQFNAARMSVIDKANERAGQRLVEPDKLTHGERIILNAAAELLATSRPTVTPSERERFVEAGWAYLHSIADGGVCGDGSCHRCRVARVVSEAESAVAPEQAEERCAECGEPEGADQHSALFGRRDSHVFLRARPEEPRVTRDAPTGDVCANCAQPVEDSKEHYRADIMLWTCEQHPQSRTARLRDISAGRCPSQEPRVTLAFTVEEIRAAVQVVGRMVGSTEAEAADGEDMLIKQLCWLRANAEANCLSGSGSPEK